MKTFESLRLGSWVNPNFPMQVTAIFDDEVWADFEGNEGDNWVFSEVEPIPLAEDWLAKLGFEDNGEFFAKQPFLENIEYRVKKVFDSFIFSKGFVNYNHELKQIQYVHDLQNGYYYHTDEELTIKPQTIWQI